MTDMQNHVTEEEMKAFFSRLITSFVAASDQAKKLEALTARFDETAKQVQSITAENQQVRAELYRTVVERDKAQREVEVYKGLSESYQRDADELRQRLKTTSDDANVTSNKLYSVAEALRITEDKLRWVEETLKGTANDLEFWRTRAFEAEKVRDEANDALIKEQDRTAKMRNFFSEFFGDGPKTLEHKPGEKAPGMYPPVEESRPLSTQAAGQDVGSVTHDPSSGQGNTGGDRPLSSASQDQPSESSEASQSTTQSTEEPTQASPSTNSPEPSHGEIIVRHEPVNTWDKYLPDGRENPDYIPF